MCLLRQEMQGKRVMQRSRRRVRHLQEELRAWSDCRWLQRQEMRLLQARWVFFTFSTRYNYFTQVHWKEGQNIQNPWVFKKGNTRYTSRIVYCGKKGLSLRNFTHECLFETCLEVPHARRTIFIPSRGQLITTAGAVSGGMYI